MTTTDTNNQPPQGGQTPNQQGDSTTQQQQQQGQTPPTSQQTPPTNANQNSNQYTSIDSLPPDIQDYIKRLRHENEEANKKAKSEAQAKQQAELERQKQQGEWQRLAETHEATVKELEPKAAELAEITAMITQQIEAETKDWPASVKAMAPGPKASLADRLAWRTKGQVIIAELANTQRGQAPGNGQNPPSVGGNQQSQAGIEELRQRSHARYGNPF